MKRKLLIATTNKGKFIEIKNFLSGLPFIECVSLEDIDERMPEPEEIESSLWRNAFLKAKYYAEKTGLLALADDGGLFIDALEGWPGHKSARVANNDKARSDAVLEKMKGIKNRNAKMKTVLSLHDPLEQKNFSAYGESDVRILEKAIRKPDEGFGYDIILFSKEGRKSFCEMDVHERNAYKHRGKALIKIQYHLQNTLGSKHIVVPIGIIVKDGKVLMTLRNDPHNKKYHKKWHFPGGSVEFNETIEENLTREIKEETGYNVEIIKMLAKIGVNKRETESFKYQAFLVPFACKIIGGTPNPDKCEVMKMGWFEPDKIKNQEMIDTNKEVYTRFLVDLNEIIKKYNL